MSGPGKFPWAWSAVVLRGSVVRSHWLFVLCGVGPPVGQLNKITRTMKDAAVQAAEELGHLPTALHSCCSPKNVSTNSDVPHIAHDKITQALFHDTCRSLSTGTALDTICERDANEDAAPREADAALAREAWAPPPPEARAPQANAESSGEVPAPASTTAPKIGNQERRRMVIATSSAPDTRVACRPALIRGAVKRRGSRV
jgi:hypothetical protein